MNDVAPGTRVDRYVLQELLGEGGQGSVWRATDPLAPGQQRAVKLVRMGRVSDSDLERARREARALARLTHPSLCRCYALFEDLTLDVLGFAMDYVDGMSLADAASDARMTPPLRDAALRNVAAALAFIHEAGLVHRDVKPENVLLGSAFWQTPHDPENVKLVDFGIAIGPSGAPLTQVGHAIGTPPYMAPEQIEPTFWGTARTPATDVFSFGVLVWLVAAGRHPTGLGPPASFGDYAVAYRRAAESADWPPRLPTASAFAGALARCLALHPEDRWQNAGTMLDKLGRSEATETAAPHARAPGPGNTVIAKPDDVPAHHRPTIEQPPVIPTPRNRPQSSVTRPSRGWWLSVPGLVIAAGVVAIALLGSDGQEDETESAPADRTSSPSATRSEAPAPPVRPSASATVLSITCATYPDACKLGTQCASGRLCNEIERCGDPLDPGRSWYLRLANVYVNSRALEPPESVSTYVCVSPIRNPHAVVCTRASHAGSLQAPRLRVTTEDITQEGLKFRIHSSSKQIGISTKPAVRDPLARSALCRGVLYDTTQAAFDGPVDKVLFYLDEQDVSRARPSPGSYARLRLAGGDNCTFWVDGQERGRDRDLLLPVPPTTHTVTCVQEGKSDTYLVADLDPAEPKTLSFP